MTLQIAYANVPQLYLLVLGHRIPVLVVSVSVETMMHVLVPPTVVIRASVNVEMVMLVQCQMRHVF